MSRPRPLHTMKPSKSALAQADDDWVMINTEETTNTPSKKTKQNSKSTENDDDNELESFGLAALFAEPADSTPTSPVPTSNNWRTSQAFANAKYAYLERTADIRIKAREMELKAREEEKAGYDIEHNESREKMNTKQQENKTQCDTKDDEHEEDEDAIIVEDAGENEPYVEDFDAIMNIDFEELRQLLRSRREAS